MTEEGDLLVRIISENEEKGTQLRLVLSGFKGNEYLHLRKYYINYEGEYVPSKEGASFPATIGSIYAILDGLIEICSKQESLDAISNHFNIKCQTIKESMPGP